jgi:hypothetical protein
MALFGLTRRKARGAAVRKTGGQTLATQKATNHKERPQNKKKFAALSWPRMAKVRLFAHYECAHIPRFVSDVRWLHWLCIRPLLIGDPVRIQEAREYCRFYREIHVLR